MRILVLDDEADVREGVAARLRRDGHVVSAFASIAETELALRADNFDVLVLDRALADGDVTERLGEWLENGVTARILLLTAAGAVRDRVQGLAAGADDYLIKPFALAELSARVRALGRRPAMPPLKDLRVADLHIVLAERTVTRAGIRLPLRPKEFALLEALARRSPRPVDRQLLRELVWGDEAPAHSNVDEVTIASLRRKLGNPSLIQTIRGVGWALAEEG